MPTRTPPQIRPVHISLARDATQRTDAMPLYVKCSPVQGAPYNECFSTVAGHIAQHGGKCVHGWAIWETKPLYVEAEFHAVWQAPDGRIVDVSPRATTVRKILFARDPGRVYAGTQVNSVRRSICKDADVQRWLDIVDRHFEAVSEYDIQDEPDALIEASIEAIEHEMAALTSQLVLRYPGVLKP